MNTTEEIIKDNAVENDHLRKMVARLSDEEMGHSLEAGWTVSAVLAHLAFWDQRAITLIRKWEKEGVGASLVDTDIINETARIFCLAIPVRKAAELAVTLADEVDQVIAGLAPEMAEVIQLQGTGLKLRRADHRRAHLGEIEKVVEKKAAHS
jgi:hypothetical protein